MGATDGIEAVLPLKEEWWLRGGHCGLATESGLRKNGSRFKKNDKKTSTERLAHVIEKTDFIVVVVVVAITIGQCL